jgi:hypothetical protein
MFDQCKKLERKISWQCTFKGHCSTLFKMSILIYVIVPAPGQVSCPK